MYARQVLAILACIPSDDPAFADFVRENNIDKGSKKYKCESCQQDAWVQRDQRNHPQFHERGILCVPCARRVYMGQPTLAAVEEQLNVNE